MMPQRPLSVQSPFDTQAVSDSHNAKIGKVFLVGAGPGDPGLITLRGAHCLSRADFVLYDGLANPHLLQLAASAELICVGKHGIGPLWTQDGINRRLIELAQQGHQVVRLKGGDPAVFARSAEELEAIQAAGLPFEVVPGITAALAAASYVGIPITHRDHASAVAFITGQQQSDPSHDLDWAALARFPGTLVFYMGVTTAGVWSDRLIAEGKSAATPAAIVRRVTWSDQRVIRCTLGEVREQLTPASKLRPPVIVIIGAVAELGQEFNWFDALPLRGQGVWVTRPEKVESRDRTEARRSSATWGSWAELGAEVYQQAMLKIEPLSDYARLDQAIDYLIAKRYFGVGLTSRHAVDALLTRLWQRSLDARVLANVKIACVGGKTAEALEAYGLRADLIPEQEYSGESLARAVVARGWAAGQRWLLPQAEQARETLAAGLIAAGAEVDRVVVYRSEVETVLSPEIAAAIDRGALQWVTITSPSIARGLHALLSERIGRLKPISLSSAISQQLAELGWPAAVEAQQASEEAMIDALVAEVVGSKE